jgi:N-carbamoyl-L-amino-acid hydrolase
MNPERLFADNPPWQALRVNAKRLHSDFEALAEIGSTGDGGVNRPSFSPAYLEARRWLKKRIQDAGLEFQTDSAGNHSARLLCGPQNAPTLLLGSHLDSVPYGGRFDGALGVLAALEVLRTLQDAGVNLPVHLEAIDFTDEEGTISGLLGSRALAGKLTPADLANPRGGRDALLAGLKVAGVSESGMLAAGREPPDLAGYLELHIEQGPRLLQAEAQIGIVTAIVGICSYRLVYLGRADHAGTTPLPDRLDAALGASQFILAVRATLQNEFPGCVANVGALQLQPGVFNIVPARADLSLELRAPDPESLTGLEDALLHQARDAASQFGLGLDISFLGCHLPVQLSSPIREAIAASAHELGLRTLELSSGAGHDAQSIAALCPAGMIFVPSQGGTSHSPREFTNWEDCLNGANVLLQAALHFAHTLSEPKS